MSPNGHSLPYVATVGCMSTGPLQPVDVWRRRIGGTFDDGRDHHFLESAALAKRSLTVSPSLWREGLYSPLYPMTSGDTQVAPRLKYGLGTDLCIGEVEVTKIC
jgi:hypothetical protein